MRHLPLTQYLSRRRWWLPRHWELREVRREEPLQLLESEEQEHE